MQGHVWGEKDDPRLSVPGRAAVEGRDSLEWSLFKAEQPLEVVLCSAGPIQDEPWVKISC